MNKKLLHFALTTLLLLIFITPHLDGWGQTYNLITSVDEITDGDYVIAAKVGDRYYALSNTFATQIAGSEITVTNNAITASDANGFVVTIAKDNNNRISISNGTDYLNCKNSATSFEVGNSAYMHDVTKQTSNGSFQIKHQSATRAIIYRAGTTNKFGNYSTTNVNGTEYFYVELFKYTAASTSPTITVNPSSVTVPNQVAGSYDGSQYATLEVEGSNLTGDVTLSLEDGDDSPFEMSTDPETWSSSLTLTKTGSSLTGEVSVRLKNLTVTGNYSDQIILSSNGANDVSVSVSGSVTNQTYTLEDVSTSAQGSVSFTPASPIEAGTTVTLTPNPTDAYTFSGTWKFYDSNMDEITSITVNANNQFTMPAQNLYVEAVFTVKQTFAITCNYDNTQGSVSANPASAYEGQTVTLTATPAQGYSLATLTAVGANDNPITITNNQFTMPGSAVTVTATFENVVVDVLDRALTDVTGTSYSAWSDKTSNSDAVYAGNSAGGNSSIQLRSSDNSGIITTTSGGKAKKVAVTWESHTTNGRTLQVYGKNTAYTAVTELYNTDNQGTLLGTIVYGSSTELTISGDYAYIGLRSSSGAMYLSEIRITWQPVTKYNVTCLTPTGGSIAADKATAAEGETVTLTATPADHYNLVSWTVLDGDAQTVTVTTDLTDPNKATFTMPASDVEVDATFVEDTKYTITIPAEIADYVTTDALQGNVAYEGEKLTITVTAPTGKVLETLSIKDADDNNVGFAPEVSAANDVYYFEMPASDITISATFADPATYTVTYYVNGVFSSSEQVVEGSQANLPATANVPTGYSFVGWTTDETVSTVVASFAPNGDASLYAVFAKTEPVMYTFTITTDDFNGTSYSANDGDHTVTATSSSGETMTVGYTTSNVMRANTSGVLSIQWRKNPAGIIYNTTDLGVINNINVAETTSGALTTIVGSTQQPDTEGSGGYFCIKNNGSDTGKASSVTVTFSKDKTYAYTSLIDVAAAFEMELIPATYLVTVKDGGVLTLTGANQGTAANLIIEDGGQLITTNAVAATLRKNISKYEGEKDNYYLIATPVAAGTGTEAVAIGTYDLYSYDEPTHYWMNAEAEGATLTTLTNGTGYLYANAADQTLEFVGTMKARGSHPTASLTAQATELTGFNLVGNPFPCNLNINELKVGTEAVSTIYQISDTEIGEVTVAQNTTIAPAEGFFVVATEGGTLHFEPQTEGSTANAVSDLLMEVRASERNAKLIDRVYVNFNQGSNVVKFQLNEANSKLYIPQGSKDYAVVRSQGEGELPVNFKADKNGAYTLSIRPENVEMDYLHLIDNLTGAEVDLLATPTYTFNAKKTDYASRFRLVFSTTGVEENGTETNASFAFFNGSEWVVNASDNATLEVIDMMGRTVLCKDVARSVGTDGMAQGVYVLRLVDGNSVKTQKIVVR